MAPTETVWPIGLHTVAKHRLLTHYLHAWFAILGQTERRILHIDGFAGPGRYKGGEPGSPLIAIRSLLDHVAFPKMSQTQFLFYFMEADSERADNLRTELQQLFTELPGGPPKNVIWGVRNQTFSEGAKEIVDSLGPGKQLVPTFAFVDPFGFSGVSMNTVRRLLSSAKCEVLVNFMIDQVNRWATGDVAPGVSTVLDDLFATDEYKNAPASGPGRADYLLGLYRQQLETVARFRYTRSFGMVNSHGRTGYHLVFGTRHPKGLEAMKQAMWKVDPETGRRFSAVDELRGPSLFQNTPRIEPLRDALQTRFRGRTVPIEEVATYVLEGTDFLPDSHLKTLTLVPMERDGLITVPGTRKRAFTYPKGTRIAFNP